MAGNLSMYELTVSGGRGRTKIVTGVLLRCSTTTAEVHPIVIVLN